MEEEEEEGRRRRRSGASGMRCCRGKEEEGRFELWEGRDKVLYRLGEKCACEKETKVKRDVTWVLKLWGSKVVAAFACGCSFSCAD